MPFTFNLGLEQPHLHTCSLEPSPLVRSSLKIHDGQDCMIDVAGTHMARRELCQGENDYDNPSRASPLLLTCTCIRGLSCPFHDEIFSRAQIDYVPP